MARKQEKPRAPEPTHFVCTGCAATWRISELGSHPCVRGKDPHLHHLQGLVSVMPTKENVERLQNYENSKRPQRAAHYEEDAF